MGSIIRVGVFGLAGVVAGSLVGVGAGCASEKPKEPAAAAPAGPVRYEESFDARLTARVKAVDVVTRRLTLEGDSGASMTFVVDPAVQRLGEIRPGDRVTAEYRATLLAELRAPTAEESAAPIAYVDVAGRAPRSEAPAAAGGQAVRVVTTVEAVDVPNMLVTLRGPLGDLAVVRGRNPDNIKRIQRGDTIVITFAEAVAVGVEKAM